MRSFILLLSILLSTVCLSSCSASTYATYSTDDYYVEGREISYNVVVTYGTPFYFNNVLSYYFYDGIYYYPYRYNSVEYLKPFRTVRPRGFVFVPGRYHVPDYRFRHHSYNKPHFHNPGRMTNHRISRPKPHNVDRMKRNGNSYRPSTRTTNNRNHIHKSQPRQRNDFNRRRR